MIGWLQNGEVDMNIFSIFTKKYFDIIIVTFLFSIQLFAQTTYYVLPSGNDANDGSEAKPCLTMQGAIDNSSVSNGDTIIVKDGTCNENVNIIKELIIKAENGYQTTTFIPCDYHYSAINITVNYVTIDGVTVYSLLHVIKQGHTLVSRNCN